VTDGREVDHDYNTTLMLYSTKAISGQVAARQSAGIAKSCRVSLADWQALNPMSHTDNRSSILRWPDPEVTRYGQHNNGLRRHRGGIGRYGKCGRLSSGGPRTPGARPGAAG